MAEARGACPWPPLPPAHRLQIRLRLSGRLSRAAAGYWAQRLAVFLCAGGPRAGVAAVAELLRRHAAGGAGGALAAAAAREGLAAGLRAPPRGAPRRPALGRIPARVPAEVHAACGGPLPAAAFVSRWGRLAGLG